ncbi:MAG: diaminopimelate epimerase [Terriglobales bacterium]
MAIPFTKASACGNDFLIIDGTLAPSHIEKLTEAICDRHNGVGADGVEWLFPAGDADVEARLINADGSAAEISGNGTRCVAAYLCAENGKEAVVIRTGAGLKTCTLIAQSGKTFEFETAMGSPQVGRESAIKTSFGEVEGIPVSMGNPHFVVLVSEFWPDWQQRAAEIQRDPGFKQGINIELVLMKDKQHIDVRFFERGVGETQSSGTGSCAAAVAAIVSAGADSPLRVHAPGGTQVVRFERELWLQGPAQLLCRGEFFI